MCYNYKIYLKVYSKFTTYVPQYSDNIPNTSSKKNRRWVFIALIISELLFAFLVFSPPRRTTDSRTEWTHCARPAELIRHLNPTVRYSRNICARARARRLWLYKRKGDFKKFTKMTNRTFFSVYLPGKLAGRSSFRIGVEPLGAAMTFNEGDRNRAHGFDVTGLCNNKQQNPFPGPTNRSLYVEEDRWGYNSAISFNHVGPIPLNVIL